MRMKDCESESLFRQTNWEMKIWCLQAERGGRHMINDRGSVSHEIDTHRKGRMESPQIKKAFFQTLRQREL